MNGAQALIQSLLQEQVEHIFGYAGATICPAVDALKATPQIGYTLVRTEQDAGHMASGYARISGKTGVCMVTSGPGATNLITGIATAYMDSIPLVAITGQVPSQQEPIPRLSAARIIFWAAMAPSMTQNSREAAKNSVRDRSPHTRMPSAAPRRGSA